MRLAATLSLFLVALALAAPGLAPSGDLEHNRRLLAKWRNDPAHYARLKQNLAAFEVLPADRRAALRQLDEELHQQDPAVRNRLWHVMDRYATWLERLPREQREQLEATTTTDAKLALIREWREREWERRLPKAWQERVAKAAPEKRAELVREFREQERERRLDWQRAVGAAEEPPAGRLPTRLADLPAQVQNYVYKALLPLLSADERERLWRAEGQSPLFARTLLDLVDRHPAALPGPPGPVNQKELPKEVRERLQQIGGKEAKLAGENRGWWPDYAIAVTRVIRAHGRMPRELGPSRPDEFPPAVRQFVTEELLPKLNDKEKQRLAAADGRWPDYPREVMQLARHHNLQVPGLMLPGPRGYWERLRTAAAQ